MKKFTNVKCGDEIYSLVFGLGEVTFVLDESLRMDEYYIFTVEYKNGPKSSYTEDGKPNWCEDKNKCNKTILYKSEVDFTTLDSKPNEKVLTLEKIIKHKSSGKLEMQSPAGAWVNASLMPNKMVDRAIAVGNLHLFRKRKK